MNASLLEYAQSKRHAWLLSQTSMPAIYVIISLMKSTLVAPDVEPEERSAALEAAASEHASRALVQPQGRDFAVFLLLLLAVDASSVLHIYNLTRLYNEYLFLGVGLFFVLCALLLLLVPRYGLPL